MKLSLNNQQKQLFLKTIIWNNLIKFFKEKNNIDISDFLISIKISWKNIFIKTLNPLLNSEILLYKSDIFKNIWEKIKNVDENIDDYKIILK